MSNFLKRHRDPLIVGALLLGPLVFYLTLGHRGREPNTLDKLVLGVSAPVQSGLTWAIARAGGAASGYVALRGAREEYEACRVELSQTQAELNSLEESRAENTRLKGMLGYAEATSEQEIVARVIGLNPSAQYQSLRIDRGEDDGVRVGMPVVTVGGVVGQVVRAVGGSADVLLLTDPTSRIGALLQRSRVRGSVSGTGDGQRLSLNLVRREDDAQNDDAVVTAGSDGIFPRGLLIGAVKNVQRPPVGMFLLATVVPAVDLSRLEEVMVIPVDMGTPSVLVGKEGAR